MKKNYLLLILIGILFVGAMGVRSYSLLSAEPDSLFGWKYPVAKFPAVGLNNDQLAFSSVRVPKIIPEGFPVRLKIPVIGVNSIIEDALITHDGRMDVPAGSVNVAWFALGPHPGQVGSAVIGGHFGIKDGVPFVFYNLDKLKIDDKIYIVNDRGETLAFVVRSIKSFDRNADATTVFTSDDGLAHLNLITCEGKWNQINGSYPLRLVIFTDAIPGESNITISKINKPKLPETAITTEISKTTATSTPTPTPTSTPTSTSPNQPLASLYSTPRDGLITSLLLISIVFVIFKIVGRF